MSEEEFEKEFNDIQTTAFLTKEEILQAYRKLQRENQQLKSVLNEVREYIEKEVRFVNMQEYHNLLELLDKVGDK